MNRLAGAFLFAAILASSAAAFDCSQVFREERFSRGNVNLRVQQPADEADWIWIDDAGPAGKDIDAVRFEADFTSSGDALVVDVSADERFVLFLDGREIARGPHKGVVNHWYYETYEITGLARGTHRMEAVAYRMGDAAPRAVLTSGVGGFLVKASGAYDSALTTGRGAWRARRISGTEMGGFVDGGWYAVAEECRVRGTGILDPGAAGKATSVRKVRKRIVDNGGGVSLPGWALFPTERPDQIAREVRPGRFVAGQPLFKAGTNSFYSASDAAFPLNAGMNDLLSAGRAVTIPAHSSARFAWYLGDYVCCHPMLKTSGGRGAEIRWGWAESIRDRNGHRGNRTELDGKRFASAIRDTFLPDGRANAEFAIPWWRCGRWCEFEVRTAGEPLVINALFLLETRYPLECRASFACDDPSIAAIWDICRSGVENCMHETYMDCPYYEQQMYPGDTRVVMLIVDALSGDPRLTRFGVGLFDYARRENGLVPMNFPCRTVQDSATYSLCWVAMLGDYALWQGGDAWLKARLPGMRHTLHAILGFADETGLLASLPGWSFMDWVEDWNHGVAPDGEFGRSAANNLLAVYALGLAARAEETSGDRAMASYWRARGKTLADAVMRVFWDERRGLVADTSAKDRFSEHAQCLALLSGILPPDRERRVVDGLFTAPDFARTTVYFSHYLFDTFFKYGRADLFLKRLDLWRNYVKIGLKTPLEAPGSHARSDCHAWGSHPIYHLLTGVAGMRPASSGFGSLEIAPQPGGLKRINASMPTPKGMASVALRFADGGVSGTVDVPKGLPAKFVWNGRTVDLASGRNEIGETKTVHRR